MVHRYKDSAYGLTLIWAFVAIYGRQQATPIRVVALSCTAVTFMFSLASVLRRCVKLPALQHVSCSHCCL